MALPFSIRRKYRKFRPNAYPHTCLIIPCRNTIKAKNEMDDPVVLTKAKAARKWVHHANNHAAETGGKSWTYVLVPHDAVKPSATLTSLVASYAQAAELLP